jgi:DDE superfamily endonuclease
VGKVANGITTVHLSYVRERTGHALISARQRIPQEHIRDPVCSLGLPEDLVFRTKGELAIDIAAGALAHGATFDFVCGDEVYGACTRLREFFEVRQQTYVLRVPRSFHLTLARGITLTCADVATSLLKDPRRWEVRSAGKGSKGERWAASAWTSPRSASTTRSTATPCWSWPRWRPAPSPPLYCATVPIPRHHRRRGSASHHPPTPG